MQYFEVKRPPTLNTIINANRTSRVLGANQKKKWTNYVKKQAIAAELQPVEDQVWIAVHITYHQAGCDPDNLFACLKFILDGLQKASVIKTDNVNTIKKIYYTYSKQANEQVQLRIFDNYSEYQTYVLSDITKNDQK